MATKRTNYAKAQVWLTDMKPVPHQRREHLLKGN